MWKTQPKLFQNCAKLHTRQKTVSKPNFVKRIARKLSINVDKKPFSNQILSRESLLGAKTTRKLSLKEKNANGMPLLSKSLKIQYPRNKPIPYKFPALWKRQAKLYQNCANLNTKQDTVFKANFV